MKRLKITILFLSLFLIIILIVSGCRANRDVSDNLKYTATAAQQTDSGGSSQAEVTADETSAGNVNNSFNEPESSNQTNNGDETTIESGSNNESETTIDENKILFTFVISGDNRPANNENPQPGVFVKLLKYMKQQNPVFYINTGDIIMGNTDNENVIKRQFSDYLDAIKNLGVLNFVAPGNHDVVNNTSEEFFREMINLPVFENSLDAGISINPDINIDESLSPETGIVPDLKNTLYYCFEYRGLWFVVLNTYEKGYWGFVKGGQLSWLEQLLDKLKDKPVFVFLHPPAYSVLNPDCITDGSQHVAFSSKENQDYIRALFAKDKVDGVFCGHEHLYNKQEHDGVQYIITGCSGASPYAPADQGGIYHFIKVQVRAKSWTMDVIDSSGNKVYTEEISFN